MHRALESMDIQEPGTPRGASFDPRKRVTGWPSTWSKSKLGPSHRPIACVCGTKPERLVNRGKGLVWQYPVVEISNHQPVGRHQTKRTDQKVALLAFSREDAASFQ